MTAVLAAMPPALQRENISVPDSAPLRTYSLTDDATLEVHIDDFLLDEISLFSGQPAHPSVRLVLREASERRVVGEVRFGVAPESREIAELEKAAQRQWNQGLSPRWIVDVLSAIAKTRFEGMSFSVLHPGETTRSGRPEPVTEQPQFEKRWWE
jgi:hypothetical protein